MPKATRRVTISRLVPKKGRPSVWAYGYQDLAALFGMSYEAVKKAAARGLFNPEDLASVTEFALKKRS